MKIQSLFSSLPADGSGIQPPFTTITENSTQNNTLFNENAEDNIGSLYYVVAVIFIYGFSIVLMIASHIRKNQQDNQLRTYLKEMALLRKKDRREKIMGRMTTLNANNTVCSNLHNSASGATGLLTTTASGQALVNTANGNMNRVQQPALSGCNFAHMNIVSCAHGFHMASINLPQNNSNVNPPKNNQSSFLHDCVVNCSNSPQMSNAQPAPFNGGSSVSQCEANCTVLPLAPFTTAAVTTTTKTNPNNNSLPSSSSTSSNSSSISTTAITTIANTLATSSPTPDTISTTSAASSSGCDSIVPTTASRMSIPKSQQQQNYINHPVHPPKIDEAQEIMLLQAHLSQIQQQHQQQQSNKQFCISPQQQQQLNTQCIDPIFPLKSLSSSNEQVNQENLSNETNIQIMRENVIT